MMIVSVRSAIKRTARPAFFLILAAVLLLCAGCQSLRAANGTEKGFVLKGEGTEYELCSPFAVKPIALGEPYAQFEGTTFY